MREEQKLIVITETEKQIVEDAEAKLLEAGCPNVARVLLSNYITQIQETKGIQMVTKRKLKDPNSPVAKRPASEIAGQDY